MTDYDQDAYMNERVSLYDRLDNKNQSTNRKNILHRAVIIARLRNNFNNKSKIGEYYEKMFRNQQQKQNPNPFVEKVTGINIIYPTLMVHLVETSLEGLKELFKDMDAMQLDPEGMIEDSRIINIDHEIHVRLYPIYVFKIMNLSLEYDSNDPSESVENLVNDIITRLLRLGKLIADQSKNQVKKEQIESLHEQHPELLPNQNYVMYLTKRNELWSVREYLNFYEKPFKFTLESELTWPAPSKLFPYN